ncbi:ParA family protein [Rhodococcus qingshengii]|uniref:ParA family protein n=1 Tax=Rhodococcus qingshengii TaxID=334542 RepID=UPI001C4E001B|nr:ParA family protein [Rhodococcus qingshengii]MCD2135861.1 ParA family protein [Rhodococcus qingshengii]UGQ55193.1 ParA family protein [Rhodococcus qingshengii]
MAKIIVLHSRKGGVGKSTIAYELAYLLGAPLVDTEHDGGGVTRKFGYRHEERLRAPMLQAFESGKTPKLLKGHNKARLLPGHPDLYVYPPSEELMAESLLQWASDWGDEYVVVDTHPGASSTAHGAMSVADLVLTPTALRTLDLDGTEQFVKEAADYPLAIVPNFVPRTPPQAEIDRLRQIVSGTPVQVTPFVPAVLTVGTRKKRMAITAEEPPSRSLQPVAEAMTKIADFVKGYVHE